MTQFTLKWIALIAMVLDHTAKVLLPAIGWFPGFQIVQIGMIALGRLAFPIFAWFVAEGCGQTKNISRYALRLLLFGALAELPFQLCFNFYLPLEFGFHNVMFTMFLAVAAIGIAQTLEKRGLPAQAAKLIPAAVSIGLGMWLETDYNGWGVALILGLYYLSNQKARLMFLAMWVTVFQLLWHSYTGWAFRWLNRYLFYWLGGLLTAPLLSFYQGEPGRRCKWLFYWFYPVHLGLLWLLSRAIGTLL